MMEIEVAFENDVDWVVKSIMDQSEGIKVYVHHKMLLLINEKLRLQAGEFTKIMVEEIEVLLELLRIREIES